MKIALFAAVALMVCAASASAEPATPASSPPLDKAADAKAAEARAAAADKTKAARDGELSADMASTLRKAGFTDLQIMPNSVFVRGKDKAGNPVAMVLNPGSMTEVVTLDPHSGSAAGGDGTASDGTAGTRAPLTGSVALATVLPGERLASTLIGLTVHDAADGTLGTINDLAIDHDGVQAYILAVGGVLGLGDRYVAVTPAALTITYDGTANSYRAAMNATADQLTAAPDFTYEGPFKASRQ